jgi:hypothetical protein
MARLDSVVLLTALYGDAALALPCSRSNELFRMEIKEHTLNVSGAWTHWERQTGDDPRQVAHDTQS